jgi:fatty-acyl-CoA synthase
MALSIQTNVGRVHLVHSLFTGSGSLIHLDDRSVGAQQVAAEGARLARALGERGLVAGDRLAIWAPNGLSYLRCLAAAAAGRYVVVSINTRFSEDEARVLLGRSGSRVLVSDRDLVNAIEGVDRIAIDDVEALCGASDPIALDQAHPDDPYIVFTTSGTTNRPKLVLHQQKSITIHAHDVARLFDYERHDARVLVAMPLCGVFGLSSMAGALAGNAEIWMPGRFVADETAELIESQAITDVNGSDDMFHRLLSTGRDLSSVRLGGYARFNSSLDGVVARAERAGVILSGLYGMSEVQALFALRDPSEPTEGRERAGGRPASADAAFRVVDPESGQDCAVGEDGELVLRGPSLFAGYLVEGGDLIDADLTADNQMIDAEGVTWFKTGDLGCFEDDGTFTYLTRIGDVLRLGGFLVSPAEIEAVILEASGVDHVQVVTVARPEGVRPVAVVIAGGPIIEAEIIAHCRQRLAVFKCPIAVVEVESFPTIASANGTKIQRNKLRELAQSSLSGR